MHEVFAVRRSLNKHMCKLSSDLTASWTKKAVLMARSESEPGQTQL
jgi:hypothetical protein